MECVCIKLRSGEDLMGWLSLLDNNAGDRVMLHNPMLVMSNSSSPMITLTKWSPHSHLATVAAIPRADVVMFSLPHADVAEVYQMAIRGIQQREAEDDAEAQTKKTPERVH